MKIDDTISIAWCNFNNDAELFADEDLRPLFENHPSNNGKNENTTRIYITKQDFKDAISKEKIEAFWDRIIPVINARKDIVSIQIEFQDGSLPEDQDAINYFLSKICLPQSLKEILINDDVSSNVTRFDIQSWNTFFKNNPGVEEITIQHVLNNENVCTLLHLIHCHLSKVTYLNIRSNEFDEMGIQFIVQHLTI